MKNIFFSYSHDQESKVQRIKNDLEELGHKVWIDRSELRSGTDWQESITKAILDSDLVFAFISARYIRKESVCMNELALAVGHKCNSIRTVLLDENVENQIPSSVSRIQYCNMCKWDYMEEQGKNEFEQWYNDKFLEIVGDIERDDSFEMDEQLSLLEKTLQPDMSYSRCLKELQKTYVNRKQIDNSIDKWLREQRDSPLFLIYGDPGTGKSAFAARYYHFDFRVVASAFCENYTKNLRSQEQMLRTIAFQMASKLPTYRQKVAFKIGTPGFHLNDYSLEELFLKLIIEPMVDDISLNNNDIVIVIDGLDEADADNDNTLASVISEHSEKIPRGMHFVITSRNDTVIQRHFNGHPSLIIDQMGVENYRDIFAYLKDKLSNELQRYGEIEGTAYLESICRKCENSFLYAEMMVRAIKQYGTNLHEIDAVPSGLNSIYFNWMHRLFKDEDEYLDDYYDLISVLCAWEFPVPFDELCKLYSSGKQEIRKKLRHISTFLGKARSIFGSESYYFFHRSFREWLLSDASDCYQVDAEHGMDLLCNCMLASYNSGNMNDYEVEYICQILEKTGRNSELDSLLSDKEFIDKLFVLGKRYSESEGMYLHALHIFSRIHAAINDEAFRNELSFEIAKCQYFMGDYGKSLEIIERNGIDSTEARIMKAIAYDWLGNRDKSVEVSRILVEESNQNGNVSGRLIGLLCIAWNDHFNDIENAVHWGDHFRDYKGLSRSESLAVKLSLARIEQSLGNLEKALSIYEECVDEYLLNSECRAGYIGQRNSTLIIEIITCYYDIKEFEKAVEIGERIFAVLRGKGWYEECYCSSWLSLAYLKLGCVNQAKEHLTHSMILNEMMKKESSSKTMEMVLFGVKAKIELYENRIEDARNTYIANSRIANECNDSWYEGDACYDVLRLSWINGFDLNNEGYYIDRLRDLSVSSGLPHLHYKSLQIAAWKSHDHELMKEAREFRMANTLVCVDNSSSEKIEEMIIGESNEL